MFTRALPLLAFVATATAAPVPKPKGVAITVANADQLQSVHEVKADVIKILPGPKAGELTFVRWEKPVDAVDEVTLKPVRTLVEGKPIAFAASADGTRFAWCENDTKVRTRAVDEKVVTTSDVRNEQPAPVFSPDGKRLAVGGYGTRVKVLNANGALVFDLNLRGEGWLNSVFSPDGKVLAVGDRYGATRLLDAATGEQLHLLEDRDAYELAFSPDGKSLAVVYAGGTVAVWDVARGEKKLTTASGCTEAYSVAWSPAGDVLATSGRRGKVVVWEAATLKPLKELDAGQCVASVRFSGDGSRLYTAGGSDQAKADRKVIVWAPQK